MNVFLSLVLSSMAVILGWLAWEMQAIRKTLQARWDYERAKFITSSEDCLSETEAAAFLMDVLAHPYELPRTIRKSNVAEQHEADGQCAQLKCTRI